MTYFANKGDNLINLDSVTISRLEKCTNQLNVFFSDLIKQN